MTDTVLIPRDRSPHLWTPDKPSWRGLRLADGTRSASVACAQCGLSSTLTGHEIAADGTVTPSLQCPHKGCSWHVHVQLAGWEP